MKPNFSSTLLAVTTAILSSFTLMGSASAVSFESKETADQFNSVFEYLKYGELSNLDTSMAPAGTQLVDLNNLFLNYDSEVSITFLGEGTVKKNHLDYSVNGGDSTNIWKRINAADGSEADFLNNDYDPTDGTMQYGDTKNLGSFAAGDQFEFLLSAGRLHVPGVRDEFSSMSGNNPDELQHAVGYALNDRYMILGFEDLYGEWKDADGYDNEANYGEKSDRDFNDVLFLVDMGEGNLASVPEPATTSALFAAGALGLFGVRRRKNS